MATVVAAHWRYGSAALNRDRAILREMAEQCQNLVLSTAHYAGANRRLAGKLFTMQATVKQCLGMLDTLAVYAGEPEPSPEPAPAPAPAPAPPAPEPVPVPEPQPVPDDEPDEPDPSERPENLEQS